MIDEDWLQNAIKSQAKQKFEQNWEDIDFPDDNVRMAYMQLKNTSEWTDFRKAVVAANQKQITNNVLNQLQGINKLLQENDH